MATPTGPQSPSWTQQSPNTTLKKDKKEDTSLLERIGTLGRKSSSKSKDKEGNARVGLS